MQCITALDEIGEQEEDLSGCFDANAAWPFDEESGAAHQRRRDAKNVQEVAATARRGKRRLRRKARSNPARCPGLSPTSAFFRFDLDLMRVGGRIKYYFQLIGPSLLSWPTPFFPGKWTFD